MSEAKDQRSSNQAPRRPKRRAFADLYGIWKGKSDFSYEEIKEAEIKLKDDWLDELPPGERDLEGEA